jgi:prevent-host-death family protein
MRIAVSEANTQLTELVRLAEAGQEIILTRHGQATVRLVPVSSVADRKARRDVIQAAREAGAAQAAAGPPAARSQDFLYNEDGLPDGTAVIAGQTPAPTVFRPAPIRGEPLSTTVLRDRR